MDTFTVSTPASAGMVRVIRAMAARAADLAEMAYDRVEDLSLAVDEAAASLLAVGTGPTIDTLISSGLNEVKFTMFIDSDAVEWPPSDWAESIGGMVLGSVADDVDFSSDSGRAGISARIIGVPI